jgi:predicted nuclease of predicted toxin-antitoxin system
MKFLIDNALSPFISQELKKLGYDALHVSEVGLKNARDKDIFETAFKEKRIIVTGDTDFGYLLSI